MEWWQLWQLRFLLHAASHIIGWDSSHTKWFKRTYDVSVELGINQASLNFAVQTNWRLSCLNLCRGFCESYDMREHSTKVVRDIISGLAAYIQSQFISQSSTSQSSCKWLLHIVVNQLRQLWITLYCRLNIDIFEMFITPCQVLLRYIHDNVTLISTTVMMIIIMMSVGFSELWLECQRVEGWGGVALWQNW